MRIDLSKVIDNLSREACENLLRSVSIECYDHEEPHTLREAVEANWKDGTLTGTAIMIEAADDNKRFI